MGHSGYEFVWKIYCVVGIVILGLVRRGFWLIHQIFVLCLGLFKEIKEPLEREGLLQSQPFIRNSDCKFHFISQYSQHS
jgi:hypothetical protein